MNPNFINVKLPHKSYSFVRTESSWWDITDCDPLTDGHIDENDSLLVNARKVSYEFVAATTTYVLRRKASKIRRLRKEVSV